MSQLIVERIDPDTTPCNDNNNPKDPDDEEVKDLDYTTHCQKTNLHTYMHLIDYPVAFTYEFTGREISDLLDALKVGCISRRPSSLHEDELDAIIERLEGVIPDTPLDGWFVRFSSNSPKDGMRVFPLMSAREIIEQIASSHRAWTALRDGDTKLYFVPFDRSWKPERELRVFIRKGKVTCISQYMWSTKGIFSRMSDAELEKLGRNIVTWVEAHVPPILEKIGVSDVTCDLYWTDDGDHPFRIIEFNSYGYWSAAGAALFHWQNNRKMLYGDGNVYFRVHV